MRCVEVDVMCFPGHVNAHEDGYGFHVISRLLLVSMERKRANDKAQDSHSGRARFELWLGHRVSEGFA
jgi:hypothetical protein